MTVNLYWEPYAPRHNRILSTALKYALEKSYPINGSITFDEEHLMYLNGILDAGIMDARILIDGINEYGSIRLWLE